VVYVFHSTYNLHVVGIKFCVKEGKLVLLFQQAGSSYDLAHDSLSPYVQYSDLEGHVLSSLAE
jgi:hypothetical protein